MRVERLTPAQTKRYLDKVKFNRGDDGCWEWVASLNACGYGIFGHNGRTWLAHKLMWHWLDGTVGKGLELDHICRNRACVRPSHLRPVTHRENMNMGPHYNAIKTHCKRGHPYAGENLILKVGGRACRACRKMAMDKANWKRRGGSYAKGEGPCVE